MASLLSLIKSCETVGFFLVFNLLSEKWADHPLKTMAERKNVRNILLKIYLLWTFLWTLRKLGCDLIRVYILNSFYYFLNKKFFQFVTQVPVADPNYYCSPKLKPEERTVYFIILFVLNSKI